MTDPRRDGWGVPHLTAPDATGLARAQGRATALDRAWQIEVERWRSEGRLAEHAGLEHIDWDRFARRSRLDDTARRCFARLDATTRLWVSAYVDGVNDGLGPGAAGAPEFAALGVRPGRWRPWTPLGVFLVAHALFGAFPHKLWRAHVAATLGDDAVDLFGIEGPPGSGSNAWALPVDPATGRAPVLAGDPHRLLELPGVYQQIRLTCPEFDVVGLAFPGVPGLPHFGHAGPVAWAVTNAMADHQDLYREQLRRDGEQVLSREADGWAPVRRHVERIAVRGAEAVEVEVLETRRGPVVDVDRVTGEHLSLRNPARVEGRLGFEALLPLLRARSADDVVAALEGWVEPVNSVLVADRDGAVRRVSAGLVPDRDERCRREPVPAWQTRYGWRGYLAVGPRPEPPPGPVVCANDRRPDVAPLGSDFCPPHRARRIRALLDEGVPAEAVLVDDEVPADALRALLTRVDPVGLGPAAAALHVRLLAWDGRMGAGDADAGAYAAWRSALARRLYDQPVLRPLHGPSRFDPLFEPWTDPRGRIGAGLAGLVAGLPRLGVPVEPVAAGALEDVATQDPAPWGTPHRVRPIHLAVAHEVAAAAAALNASTPLAGDTDCVLATTSVPGLSDGCWRGPVARYVWDLDDRDASRWIVPFGASGRPGDPHFADQFPLWAAGELIPVVSQGRHVEPAEDRGDAPGAPPVRLGTLLR